MIEAQPQLLTYRRVADDPIKPALQTARQLEVGAVDGQREGADRDGTVENQSDRIGSRPSAGRACRHALSIR